jgi:hypothetical protein
VLGLFAASSCAEIIQFEGYAPAGSFTFLSGSPYTEKGYTFTTSNAQGAIFDSGDAVKLVGDSTSYMSLGSLETLTMTGPVPFELVSLDLGPLSVGNPSVNVTVTGHISGGGTVSQTFTGLTTLTTETVDYTGLSSVTLTTNNNDAGVDNIVNTVSPVPEPCTMPLLVAGLGALFLVGRRSRIA